MAITLEAAQNWARTLLQQSGEEDYLDTDDVLHFLNWLLGKED